MTSIANFDAANYARLPIFDVAEGVGLATGLIAVAPKPLPSFLKRSFDDLQDATKEVQAIWHRVEEERKDLRRPADVRLDRLWGAFHARLLPWSALAVEQPRLAGRAESILNALFADGLTFLQLKFVAQWAESEKRLVQIEDEGWTSDVEKLVGAEFFEPLKAAHVHYGEVLGMKRGKAADVSEPSALIIEPFRRLREVMTRYAIKVAALVEPDDESSLKTVSVALAPIDVFRAQAARRTAAVPVHPPQDPAAADESEKS